jgi:hypothetical protein
MSHWRGVVVSLVVVVTAAAALTYVVDAAWARYRLARAPERGPLDQTTVYDATPLKNGKLEIFYDYPQTEVCLHSLFPHFGYVPCWYLVRHKVRVISGVQDRAGARRRERARSSAGAQYTIGAGYGRPNGRPPLTVSTGTSFFVPVRLLLRVSTNSTLGPST